MKKIVTKIIALCLIFASVLGFSACAEKEPIMIGEEAFDTLQEAVLSAESEEKTISINQDITGSGVKIGEAQNQNITINLNGHTYTVDENTVGSTGTQTSGFQLLKGSKVTIKNGTITSTNAKILIQNYCDLTLDNVTLDVSSSTGDYGKYVLSNNCGNTIIKNKSKLLARDGYTAFDVYYWPPAYSEGVSVKFQNFTGEVKGKIEYDTSSAQTGWTNYAKLTIDENSNGYFDISFVQSPRLTGAPNITIKGGVFNSEMSDLLSQIVDPEYKTVATTKNNKPALKVVKK